MISQWLGLANQIHSHLQGKISLQIELLGPDRESEQKYKKLDCEIIHGLDIQASSYSELYEMFSYLWNQGDEKYSFHKNQNYGSFEVVHELLVHYI